MSNSTPVIFKIGNTSGINNLPEEFGMISYNATDNKLYIDAYKDNIGGDLERILVNQSEAEYAKGLIYNDSKIIKAENLLVKYNPNIFGKLNLNGTDTDIQDCAVNLGANGTAAPFSVSQGFYSKAIGIGSHAEGGFLSVSVKQCQIEMLPVAQNSDGTTPASFDYPGSDNTENAEYGDALEDGTESSLADPLTGDDISYLTELKIMEPTTYKIPVGGGSLNSADEGKYAFIHVNNNIQIRKIISVRQDSGTYLIELNHVLNNTQENEKYTLYLYSSSNGTEAVGESSHAEGILTKSLGNISHAEGKNTISIGVGSHAEGEFNVSGGKYSHVEGYRELSRSRENFPISNIDGNIVRVRSRNDNNMNFSEVNQIINYQINDLIIQENENKIDYYYIVSIELNDGAYNQIRLNKIVENPTNLNNWFWIPSSSGGDYSHSEGYNSYTKSDYSHSEGYETIATGKASHAEGQYSISQGDYSHAEGYWTETVGNYSHAEGEYTKSAGKSSHAEGYYSISQGDYSHAEGSSIALGKCSHAEGGIYSTDEIKIIYTGYQCISPEDGIIIKENFNDEKGNFFISQPIVLMSKTSNEFKSGIIVNISENNNILYLTTTINDLIFDEIYDVYISTGYSWALGEASHSEGIDAFALGKCSHTQGEGTASIFSHTTVLGKYNKYENIHRLYPKEEEIKEIVLKQGAIIDVFNEEDYLIMSNNGTISYYVEKWNTLEWGKQIDQWDDISYSYFRDNLQNYYKYFSIINTGNNTYYNETYMLLDYKETYSGTSIVPTQVLIKAVPCEIRNAVSTELSSYPFVIGNGENHLSRSNACSIDWQGNAYFSGNVYTGLSEKLDEKNNNLSEYKLITKNEAENLKSWHIGTYAPSNKNLLWLNTNEKTKGIYYYKQDYVNPNNSKWEKFM